MIGKFYHAAQEVVGRNRRLTEKVIARTYIFGDSLVAAIPFVKNGFNVDAVLDRPAPLVVTAMFIAGSIAIDRGHFALGMGSGVISASLLAGDAAYHGEIYNAVTLLPAIAAGGLSGFCKPLEARFCNSRSRMLRNTLGTPKRTAGLLLCSTTYPLIGTSILDQTYALTPASVSWSIGNTAVMLLPPEAPAVTPPTLPAQTTARPGMASINSHS